MPGLQCIWVAGVGKDLHQIWDLWRTLRAERIRRAMHCVFEVRADNMTSFRHSARWMQQQLIGITASAVKILKAPDKGRAPPDKIKNIVGELSLALKRMEKVMEIFATREETAGAAVDPREGDKPLFTRVMERLTDIQTRQTQMEGSRKTALEALQKVF